MSNETTLATMSKQIEQVLMTGDLSSLTSEQRVDYHNSVCSSLGMNPLTSPFSYIKLNNSLKLYAKKDATDQLRRIYNISVRIVSKEAYDGIYMVTAEARTPDGRTDEDTGLVNIQNLKGEALANAIMKATTKAKRRVTLSICGLGMLDESEVSDITGSKNVTPTAQTHFLPENKNQYDTLIQAFMGVGVSLEDIQRTFDIETLDQLDENQIGDLREAYKAIKSGDKAKSDFFVEKMEAPE